MPDHLGIITDKCVMGINDQVVFGPLQPGIGQFDGAVMFMTGAVKKVHPGNWIEEVEVPVSGDNADLRLDKPQRPDKCRTS